MVYCFDDDDACGFWLLWAREPRQWCGDPGSKAVRAQRRRRDDGTDSDEAHARPPRRDGRLGTSHNANFARAL